MKLDLNNPTTRATVGSAIRWILAAVAGAVGWSLSEEQREEITAALVVLVGFGLSVAWSGVKNSKLVRTEPPQGGSDASSKRLDSDRVDGDPDSVRGRPGP